MVQINRLQKQAFLHLLNKEIESLEETHEELRRLRNTFTKVPNYDNKILTCMSDLERYIIIKHEILHER